MKREEGIMWCWKMNVDNILFIFREEGREIELDLTKISSTFLQKNNLMLMAEEKQFLINLKKEIYGTNNKF